ncbi:MBL fold metallo-hydrolase [Algicella marina]|uniref:MBL fold metallo-hydrolase n=1 Tax=Algicella marina TaxID=2683284 RepID=A0A6P1T091_9RHOB|nr:MBL fold metallo-hydrolase [Algicella marina]QHQ34856.1 MBL fold metallo-hydrolase [Algicella marina]
MRPDLACITAPNPGPMTGDGTNTYIVGSKDVIIIDPGPNNETHLRRILNILPSDGTVEKIIVTHSHVDHTSLARRLSDKTGAPVHAWTGERQPVRGFEGFDIRTVGGGEGVDGQFRPDGSLTDCQVLNVEGRQLQVVHTPGHLHDHICLRWPEAGIAFTGDHVMAWSTSIISPPDGDMGDYMRSLEKLSKFSEEYFLPGHGNAISNGHARIDELASHRRTREAAILRALVLSPQPLKALTKTVYADVPAHLHGAAARNVLAHLLNLVDCGKVRFAGGQKIDELLFLPEI